MVVVVTRLTVYFMRYLRKACTTKLPLVVMLPNTTLEHSLIFFYWEFIGHQKQKQRE